ncbi:MAG: 50S ribosomal protein L23 [Candidatus Woesebacteria bacterium]|jgi:large subunit ribosomal protein L23
MKAHILKRPVVTEKSLKLANSENVYTFEVAKTANKDQIKQAVEELFSVHVLAVNTVMKAKSKKRTGKKRMIKTIAKRKKALVKLQEGESIALFDVGGE